MRKSTSLYERTKARVDMRRRVIVDVPELSLVIRKMKRLQSCMCTRSWVVEMRIVWSSGGKDWAITFHEPEWHPFQTASQSFVRKGVT